MAGCGGPAKPKQPIKPEPPEKPARTVIMTEPGHTDWFGKDPNELLWRVAWKKAKMATENGVPSIGAMDDVNGQIFQKSDTKTFQAKTAVVKGSNVLSLTGSVQVYSPHSDATLKCDKLVYYGDRKVFDAQGNVSLKGKKLDIAGVPEAMADSDFTQIASPELFKEKDAAKH